MAAAAATASTGHCGGGGDPQRPRQGDKGRDSASAYLQERRRWSRVALTDGAKGDYVRCEGNDHRNRRLEAPTSESDADGKGHTYGSPPASSIGAPSSMVWMM